MVPDVNTPTSLHLKTDSSWQEIIAGAITHPDPNTFSAIALLPQASTKRALTWVTVGTLVSYTIISLWSLIRGNWFWPFFLAGLLLFPVSVIISFLLITGLVYWLANKLGEPIRYEQFALACAAFYAPLLFLLGVFTGTPIVLIIEVYWVALHTIAVKGIYKLSWTKAIIAALPPSILLLLVFCSAIAVLATTLQQAAP